MRVPIYRWIILLILLMLVGQPLAAAQTKPFSDVDETNRYHDAIGYLYEEGVVEGYSNGQFLPYREITRSEALKIILLSFDRMEETVSTETLAFQDIDSEAWYMPYVATAVGKKIVVGYDDGNFYPEKTINLAEALKMILEGANVFREPYVMPISTDDPAPDVSKDSWYADYAYYALLNNMTYLEADGNLNAQNAVTRGELADLIFRLQNPEIYSGDVEHGKATYYGLSWDGVNTASGQTLYQSEPVAAHKTLPFDTYVRVTNLNTGTTVTVRIIDRGPYGEGRIIDLSYSAFETIAEPSVGIVEVEVEIVYPQST